DIETAPALIASFSIREPYARACWVERNSYILCFAAKWSDEKKIKTYALPDYKRFKRDIHNDKSLVRELAGYLNQPDVVICAQNGDRFDLPMIQYRMLVHSIPPPAPYLRLDTLKSMRKSFKADSFKLDNVGTELNEGHKIATKSDLWKACYHGDR